MKDKKEKSKNHKSFLELKNLTYTRMNSARTV